MKLLQMWAPSVPCSSLILVPVQKPNLQTVPGSSSPFKEQTSGKRQQNALLVINTHWKHLEGLEKSHSKSFVLTLTISHIKQVFTEKHTNSETLMLQ